MPFAANGTYTPASGATTAFPGQVIASATWNSIHTDFSDALTDIGEAIPSLNNVGTAFNPNTNDSNALGTTLLGWSDLFLASGGVINWNAGDVTITHAANVLTFAGATNGFNFANTVQPNANDAAPLGSATVSWSDLFLASGGVINFNNGNATITHSANTLSVSVSTLFGNTIAPISNDGSALGSGSDAWADLFLASGGIINWNNGDVLLTHTSNLLTLTGGTFNIGTAGDGSLIYALDTISASNLGGAKIAPSFTGAITNIAGIFVENAIAAGAFTITQLYGISINGLNIGAGATVSSYWALRIPNPNTFGGAGTLTSARAIVVEGGTSEFRGAIAGGAAVGSDLILRTTTGVGDGTDYILFQRGTDGATEMARMGRGSTAQAGLSINDTTVTDNFLRFGSGANGAGFQVAAAGVSTVGTGATFSAGNSGTGGNLTGGSITYITGSGRGNTTTNQNHSFYIYFPGASGDNPQTLTQAAGFEYTATARDTLLRIYDVDNATLERVTVGVADSGGAGFKLLRIPN